MPLQPVLIGLKNAFSFFRKAVFVLVILFVILTLFSALRGLDSKNERANALAAQKAAQEGRIKMYAELSEKNDAKLDENTAVLRRMQRWSLCVSIGEFCTSNPSEAAQYKKDSLSSKMAGLIVMPLKTPPSSFIYVARDTLENAGLVPKTYAAGIGFYALSSFQPIWKAFRDLAYLVIVLIIFVVGFMVMFGVGGGGKTGVTLESALPRLVIALLAIAFSYAIAGLFIDIMYILIILVVSLLGGQAGMNPAEQGQLSSQLISGSPTDLFWQMLGEVGHSDSNYWNLATSIYNLVPGYMQAVIDGIGNIIFGTLFGSFLTSKVPKVDMGDITSHPGSWIGSWGKIATGITNTTGFIQKTLEKAGASGGGIWGVSTFALLINFIITILVQTFLGPLITKSVIMLLLILSMVVVTFRIFFALIWIYIDIILAILFAPILIMFEAIPGQNAFMKWMKGLAVNLSVFPFFAALMLIIRILMNNGSATAMWSPPFIGDMAHEIKTPLATLQTTLEVCLRSNRNEREYEEIIKEALKDANRIKNTLNQVLDLAWTESQQNNYNFEKINLSQLLDEVTDIGAKLALEKNIDVKLDIEADIYVKGQRDKLAQMFINIVENAINYTEKGSVNISAAINKNSIIVSISDTGKGISHIDLDKVFDRFYRGESSKNTKGTGIGLPIAKSIAKLHGGYIKVNSEINRGSIFSVIMPIFQDSSILIKS